MSSNVFNLPTQPLDLPSKGYFYSADNPLSSGVVELKIPTAREEDILTNRNLIIQNIAVDKFLESIIVSKVDLDDILLGDKDAIIIAARVLAYGKDYTFTYNNGSSKKSEEITIDLTELKNKEIDETLYTKGVNEFDYILPLTKNVITFKLLTGKDEKLIEAEIKSLQKVNKNMAAQVTTRLKKTIVAVNGDRSIATINAAVDAMPALDSFSLRKHIEKITPGVDNTISFTDKNGEVVEGLDLPFTAEFFWPRR